MNTTTVSSYATGSATQATPSPLPLPGSGSTELPANAARDAAAAQEAPRPADATPVKAEEGQVVVPLDTFARQGGPDAAVKTESGMVNVHAVFQMDPTTRELTVSVVDEAGRLIRMIPPDSVARMLAAMATYRGR